VKYCQQHPSRSSSSKQCAVIAGTLALLFLAAVSAAQAQSLTVLHEFTGGVDGGAPMAGLVQDSGGNLYGTTTAGGAGGSCAFGECGVVFRISHRGSVESPIYTFKGAPNDGQSPEARVTFGPDGALYGTTFAGGTGSCVGGGGGCGTVYKLQPPPTFCASFTCPWKETILYSFTSFADGLFPMAEVVFDRAGNIYGTTRSGGNGPCNYGAYSGCGTVFELTPNGNGTWSKSTLYSFQGGAKDGIDPESALVFDQAGNLYGTTVYGAGTGCVLSNGCGIVFELTPSGSAWIETVLHIFTDGADGGQPVGGVIFDSKGNLYGGADTGPGEFGLGTIFELSPQQGGGWNFNVLYTIAGGGAEYPNPLSIDAAGNLYWSGGGGNGSGAVGTLTYSIGGWSYTTLYSCASDGSQGFFPAGKVVLDAQGNIYGTNADGPYPSPDAGTVWELTP
jgi:uncharacterized repeat protein (TIGR03803 family)